MEKEKLPQPREERMLSVTLQELEAFLKVLRLFSEGIAGFRTDDYHAFLYAVNHWRSVLQNHDSNLNEKQES